MAAQDSSFGGRHAEKSYGLGEDLVTCPRKASSWNSMDKSKQASHMVLDSEPPRLDSINHATGEERERTRSTQDSIDDARELKPSGGSPM